MDRSEILALYDHDQRREIRYPGARREVTAHVVRHVDTAGAGEGTVLYSRLTEANADETIREQVQYYESIGQGFEWKVYDHDTPANLKARLAAYGFVVEEAEAVMVLELARAPATLWQPVHQSVQRITAPETLADIQKVQEQVWDEDAAWVADFLGDALRDFPDQMSVYAAYREGQPVSAAWIYFPERSQFASLWGGSTLAGFRQQGFYTALLAVRAQEAKARGVGYLTVDASPMSRPILEKFGFETITYAHACKWDVKAKPRPA